MNRNRIAARRSCGPLDHPSCSAQAVAANRHAPGRMRRLFGAIVWISTVLSGACGGDGAPEPSAERTDSAGIAIVTTRGPDMDPGWTFEPVLELGGAAEGPQAFGRVHETSVGADAQGNLYVLDVAVPHVVVFDPSGRQLRTFGRSGGGPGEFGFPTDLAVREDGRVGVYDFALRGVVLFDAGGATLAPLALPGTTRKFALAGDYVVGAFRTFDASGDSSRQRLMIVGPADTLTVFSRVEPGERPVGIGCMQAGLPPIFSQELPWSARRATIVINTSDDYTIDVMVGGALTARWRRDLPRIPSTPELAAAEIGGDSMRFNVAGTRCAVPAAEAAAKVGFAPFAPIIRNLAVAPDERVWVERRTGTPDETRIDVFTADGEYLGTLPAGSPFPAAFRGLDEIIVVTRDDLDVPRIIVYRVSARSRDSARSP